MKRVLNILSTLLLLAVLTACEHKDLCLDHSAHAHKHHINVIADYRYDWEECYGGTDWEAAWPSDYISYDNLRPSKPDGIRIINHNDQGLSDKHNISADGGVVTLFEGYNDVLFYNNDTEYILFTNTNQVASTRATTRTMSRSSYLGNSYANKNEMTMTPPDILYANYYEDLYVEKLEKPTDIEVTLQPLVYTYKVRYEFKEGLEFVAIARGALSGMARSVLLYNGNTSEESATILYDCEVTDYGVRALVNSFGVPAYPHGNYPTRGDGSYKHALNLELMLRNGSMITLEFDVTDQVQAQPHGGVIIVKDIVVEEEDGTQGSGAFDVEVNDWGPYEDIELPL